MYRTLPLILVTLLGACGGTSTVNTPPSVSIKAPLLSNVVAFMGDSITQGWDIPKDDPAGHTINFGISGQTTVQMLARFNNEVIASAPGVVVILGGTNDLAAGYTPAQILANIDSMAQLASAAGIKVILCSVTATVASEVQPPWANETAIVELDSLILSLAQQKGYLYADYYDALLLPDGTANPALLVDGLHPTDAGHSLMWTIVAPLIAEDLR